jgi:hypothetical protein
MSAELLETVGRWLFEKLIDTIVYLFDLCLRFLESRGCPPRLEVKKEKQTESVIDA